MKRFETVNYSQNELNKCSRECIAQACDVNGFLLGLLLI